jgi:predicted AlkP superfamily pyrophosphatase or phosphodiesterase
MRAFTLLVSMIALCVGDVARGQTGSPTTAPTTAPTSEPVSRVLIVSIDGLRPDLIFRAEAPTLRNLMNRGSFTLWARTTVQSTTLPSHTSMLTGVTPERHTIMWNSDLPLTEPIYPRVPTLFELAKAVGYGTAMVAGKDKFSFLNKPGTIDHTWITTESVCKDQQVRDQAVRIIRDHRPAVMFVHFPTVDSEGHGQGWGSKAQLNAVAVADACLGDVLAALTDAGTLEQTLVIVSADHGGQGRGHGPEDVRSRTIPWIAAGPGVRKDFDLTLLGRDVDVNTFDTFATACHFLGIETKLKSDGKAIVQMFESAELLK